MEAHFLPGSKTFLVALLRAIKDFNRNNSLSFRFSPTAGLSARFACGPPNDPKYAVIAFHVYQPDLSTVLLEGSAAGSAATNASGGLIADAKVGGPTPASTPAGASATAKEPSSASTSPTKPAPISVNTTDKKSASGPNSPTKAGSSTAATPPASGPLFHNHSTIMTAFKDLVCNTDCIVAVHPRTLLHQLELVDDLDKISFKAEKAAGGHIPIWELYFESQDLGRKVLYEMDTVPRMEPIQIPPPPPKYSLIVQIEALEFQRTIAALQDTSDNVVISGGKNSITFLASGPNGTLQVGLVQKPPASPEKVPRFKVLSYVSSVKHTFDTRFLRGFTAGTPLGTYVTLSFASTGSFIHMKMSYPIEIDKTEDGCVRLATSAPAGASIGYASSPTHAESATAGSPVGSPIKNERPANIQGRGVVGRLEYYLMPVGSPDNI
ncbi:hypothetical protein HDV05_000013 [Chytridiales sp. JEL 0842]|nr:hypothetical protein HDV05_000013 [Chytridiales sp. JEL 0842]